MCLIFPWKKHVVLFDAVIWREHLGPFLFHVYTPLFYFLIFSCDCCHSFNLHSCSACCPLIPVTVFCFELSPKFSLPLSIPASVSPSSSSHPNITHRLPPPPCLFYSFLSIHPLSARLPPLSPSKGGRGEEKKITTRWLLFAQQCEQLLGQSRDTRAAIALRLGKQTRQEQTHADCKQSPKQTDRC